MNAVIDLLVFPSSPRDIYPLHFFLGQNLKINT